jgi:hypothetical protein
MSMSQPKIFYPCWAHFQTEFYQNSFIYQCFVNFTLEVEWYQSLSPVGGQPFCGLGGDKAKVKQNIVSLYMRLSARFRLKTKAYAIFHKT